MRGNSACAGLVLVALCLFAPSAALAYGGPGSGISALGSLFAVLGVLFFAIVGFVWYPIKRLIGFLRRDRRQAERE